MLFLAAESDTEKLFEEYLQGNGTSTSHRDRNSLHISQQLKQIDCTI